MRATHESDCDFQVVGVCTCGAFNECRRVGGSVPGLAEHEQNLKKLRDLQRLERDAVDLVRVPIDTITPAGGEASSNV